MRLIVVTPGSDGVGTSDDRSGGRDRDCPVVITRPATVTSARSRAGVDHAVASAAHAAVVAEIASTRRQLRALRERWIPRLQTAHRSLLVTLDDQEHDEHVRLRWAADPTRSERVRP